MPIHDNSHSLFVFFEKNHLREAPEMHKRMSPTASFSSLTKIISSLSGIGIDFLIVLALSGDEISRNPTSLDLQRTVTALSTLPISIPCFRSFLMMNAQ
jgi:hypothetical protein